MVRTELNALMSDVLTLKGVTAVALVDGSGAIRASAAAGDDGFSEAGPLLASALAASGVVGDFVGGELRQTVIEYRGGPVVLTPVAAAATADAATLDGDAAAGDAGADDEVQGLVLAVRLESLDDLGRVRFHLPRVLQRVAEATSQATP